MRSDVQDRGLNVQDRGNVTVQSTHGMEFGSVDMGIRGKTGERSIDHNSLIHSMRLNTQVARIAARQAPKFRAEQGLNGYAETIRDFGLKCNRVG